MTYDFLVANLVWKLTQNHAFEADFLSFRAIFRFRCDFIGKFALCRILWGAEMV
jgi:hypothetical protein